MQQEYQAQKKQEELAEIDETPGLVQNPSSLYSFSNATSFSDFYNFVEAEQELLTASADVFSGRTAQS
jgi:hypothetical protein